MENDFKIKIIILGGEGQNTVKQHLFTGKTAFLTFKSISFFANILNITKVTYVLKLHFWRNFVHKICSHKTTI